jgi:hypothetical protein
MLPRSLIAAVVLVVVANQAIAQQKLIGRFIDPARACFVLIHARETLEKRPKLIVDTIGFGSRRSEAPVPEGYDMAATLSLRLVGHEERLRANVLCSEKDFSLNCALPDDGGSFKLQPLSNGDLRLTVGPEGVMPEGAARRIPGDAGQDSTFNLIRAGAMMCR